MLISTINKEGVPNAAVKTNFMNVSALKSLAFGCWSEHDTHRYIVETKEFVVNVPPEEIIEQVMVTAVDFPQGINEIEKAKLTAVPSEKVKPPRIEECQLHFECQLKWHRETIIVGEVVAASANEDLMQASVEQRQKSLGQMFLVGARKYGKVGKIRELPLEILKHPEEERKK